MPSRRNRIQTAGVWLAIVVLGVALAGLTVSAWDRHRPRGESAALPAEERATLRIDVLNGNGRTGEASEVARFLTSRGFRVEEIANAGRFDYPHTVVVDRAGNSGWCEGLAQILKGADVVQQLADGGSEVQVILGHDWSALRGR